MHLRGSTPRQDLLDEYGLRFDTSRPCETIQGANEVDIDRLTGGARFYLDGDQVIVALGRASGASGAALPNASAVHDDDRMYSVDAGGQQTYLTSRYFDENAAKFNNQKMEMFTLFGAQSPPQAACTAEIVPLEAGDGPSCCTSSTWSHSRWGQPRSTMSTAFLERTPSAN